MRVADVNVEGGIDGHAIGRVESRRRGQTSIAGVRLTAVAGHGVDRCAGDLADAMVVGVGDIDVAAAIDGDRGGITQQSRGGRRAVAGEARNAASGDGTDVAAAHLADAIVVGVGNIDVAAGVHGHAGGRIEQRASGRAAIAAKALRTGAGNGADQAFQIHFENHVVAGVGDEQISSRVEGYPAGQREGDVGRLNRAGRRREFRPCA